MERLTSKAQSNCGFIWRIKTPNSMQDAIDHLAAYEDTGMEPEEIQRMKEYMEPFTIQDIDRFNEIMRAEKDGRLVVLQGGATVHYLWEEYRKARCMADERLPSSDCTTGRISGFGAGVIYILDKILTQEEAEAALKKREETDNEAD